MKISLWMFRIPGFEGGIGVPQRGELLNSTGAGLLIPKGRRPFFGLFLEFGQSIADAIFVQKFSNFW
jgi:hypothetical protein